MTTVNPVRDLTEHARARSREHVSAFLDEQERLLARRGLGPFPDDDGGGGTRCWAAPLFDALRDLVQNGKLLRPAFCYWGFRAAGGRPRDERIALRAGAAIELLHLFALVHDDIIDDSATRRGRPTAHRRFAGLHAAERWRGSSEAFGTSAALLLGDLCLMWSHQLLLDEELPGRTRSALARITHRAHVDLVTGQYLDLLVEAEGHASEQDARAVAHYKTTVYSVAHPLRVGATLVDPGSPVLAPLEQYAVHLGEAFQLRDDVLGVFGDPGRTGKPASDDLRAGKQTVLIALARRDPASAAARELDALLRRGRDLTDDDLERCRELLIETGAPDEVEARIAERARSARLALDDPGLAPTVRAALGDLVDQATIRQG